MGKYRLTIEDMQRIAAERGGICLSPRYLNKDVKLKWQCSKGHIWEATGGSVKLGSWCSACRYEKMRLTIEDMHRIAVERGGKCLSTKYINFNTKLQWECSEGHVWFSTPNIIKNAGSWCPECSIGLNERITRGYFESILLTDFPKARPSWLRNSNNNQMELDGYSKELSLAFEYQGKQHFLQVDLFHKSVSLSKRKEDDLMKIKLCKKNNVTLIVIPYIYTYEKIYDFLINEFNSRGISIQSKQRKSILELNIHSPKKLEDMQRIAAERGGKCLSTKYIDWQTKLLFTCKNNHKWESAPFRITAGAWCSKCPDKRIRLDFEKLKKIITERGGNCLSDSYEKEIRINCNKGHYFKLLPKEVNQGRWCNVCNKRTKSTIEDMQRIATERGGECLSNEYNKVITKLKWKCSNGHVWEATAASILNGHWCLKCTNDERKITIEDVRKLAALNKYECLSKEFINRSTKLEWRCDKGHVWFAPYIYIKRGYGCPQCRKITIISKTV